MKGPDLSLRLYHSAISRLHEAIPVCKRLLGGSPLYVAKCSIRSASSHYWGLLMKMVSLWNDCPQPVSICELALWIKWSFPWRPEVQSGSERMIMDWIYGCFPLVTEHFVFFCCCCCCCSDQANFSFHLVSIYPASHCLARKLFFH